ncbi:MAG: hypothetical protein HC878_15935 [Leptolyngbyaceae cyanobacterium SL_5_14]|nr:hypothetical protein [Leptolyngbyaceae cyanobacterium SL_5_14]
MRERSPEASPTSNPGIRAEIGFNLQISNQTQVQFAFGQFASSTQNASNAKLKPVSPGHPAVKSPISVQDDYRIEADEPVQTDKPIGKIELVAKTELIEERDVGRAIATSSTSSHPSIHTVEEIQVTPVKTKTIATGEPDKPIYNFDGSFEWKIAPTVILNTWGGLTINPLSPDSPILALVYLGFPDPLDQEGGLVFLASQPVRSGGGRR